MYNNEIRQGMFHVRNVRQNNVR